MGGGEGARAGVNMSKRTWVCGYVGVGVRGGREGEATCESAHTIQVSV